MRRRDLLKRCSAILCSVGGVGLAGCSSIGDDSDGAASESLPCDVATEWFTLLQNESATSAAEKFAPSEHTEDMSLDDWIFRYESFWDRTLVFGSERIEVVSNECRCTQDITPESLWDSDTIRFQYEGTFDGDFSEAAIVRFEGRYRNVEREGEEPHSWIAVIVDIRDNGPYLIWADQRPASDLEIEC